MKTKTMKRSTEMKKEVNKALAFAEGNWKINKENAVSEELFSMTEEKINFVEIIQWEFHPTEK